MASGRSTCKRAIAVPLGSVSAVAGPSGVPIGPSSTVHPPSTNSVVADPTSKQGVDPRKREHRASFLDDALGEPVGLRRRRADD